MFSTFIYIMLRTLTDVSNTLRLLLIEQKEDKKQDIAKHIKAGIVSYIYIKTLYYFPSSMTNDDCTNLEYGGKW